jgi:hypothetical protein
MNGCLYNCNEISPTWNKKQFIECNIGMYNQYYYKNKILQQLLQKPKYVIMAAVAALFFALEDFRLRKLAKEIKLRPCQLIKLKFIQQEAVKGNVLAKQYLEKLRKEEVSIDWAHRVLINSIRQQRMLKMIAIADDRHFSYDNEIELLQFIASEMEKEGLDEENLDSYLNTKIM